MYWYSLYEVVFLQEKALRGNTVFHCWLNSHSVAAMDKPPTTVFYVVVYNLRRHQGVAALRNGVVCVNMLDLSVMAQTALGPVARTQPGKTFDCRSPFVGRGAAVDRAQAGYGRLYSCRLSSFQPVSLL